jgi:hypothetical protein
MFVVASLLLTIDSANAQNMALDPQNRAHVGLNIVDGPSSIGFTGGFDSRLTRLIALDVGAFASPIPIAEDFVVGDSTAPELFHLRHGVYLTPGLRIPHPQPKRWAWDVFVRAGGGVIWAANLSPSVPPESGMNYSIRPDPAGVAGADALVRFGTFGFRVFGKAWMFDVVQTSPVQTFFVVRPQWGVEALVQW